MQKIIDYFKNDSKVLLISCVTLFVVICAGLVIILIKRKRNAMQAEAKFFDEYVAQTTSRQHHDKNGRKKKNKSTAATNTSNTQTDCTPIDYKTDVSQKNNAIRDEKEEKARQSEIFNEENNITEEKQSLDEEQNIGKTQNSVDEKVFTDTRRKEMKTTKNTTKSKPSGKWIIYSYLDEKKTRLYTARLKASNGETLLDMESYTTLNGIKAGLETVRKNISANNITYKGDKNNNWNFKIYSSNKMLLCLGEGYTSKLNCESAIESVKKFSEDATVVDMTTEENEENLEVRLTAPSIDLTEPTDNVAGKWVIKSRMEDGKTWYSAQLKASNGVIILKTESYASLAGIQSGINTIKKNIAANNFEVKEDKNGNWNFKLYNARKMLLCVGEGYTSRLKCENAVNSVRRFSNQSTIVETA